MMQSSVTSEQVLEQPEQEVKPELKLDKPMREYQEILYKLCKRDYPELIRIAKMFLKRAENDYDNQIAIEGLTGSGKSMFTLIIIMLMQHIARLSFDLQKQTLFIPDEGELKDAVHALKPLGVYWIDEAIRALDKKRWYNKDQIELNHIIKTERWKRNTIIYCMPDFMDFSNSFRTSNIYFRVYIVPRTAAVVNIKDIDKDIEDPWHTKINCAIKFQKKGNRKGWHNTRYNAVMMDTERLEKETKLPNYFTHSEWPDLTKFPEITPVWDMYIKLKEKSRADELEKAKEKGDKVNDARQNGYQNAWAKKCQDMLGEGKKKSAIIRELELDKWMAARTAYRLFDMPLDSPSNTILYNKVASLPQSAQT